MSVKGVPNTRNVGLAWHFVVTGISDPDPDPDPDLDSDPDSDPDSSPSPIQSLVEASPCSQPWPWVYPSLNPP